MCGSGRLLVPLLQRGFALHGVDNAEAMLAACEARLRAAGVEPRLYRQDLPSLNLPFRYRAAFIGAGSFQLITDPLCARLALERMRIHLLPGGTLVLDLFVPAAGAHPPGASEVEVRSVKLADGARITLRSESTVDAPSRLIEWRNRYERRAPGSVVVDREDEALSLTWYARDEIDTLLREAGFAEVAIGPSWSGDADERSFAAVAHTGNG